MKYLYCIANNDCINDLTNLVGINDMPVTTLLAENFVCVMSDVDEAEKSLDRDAAMAHQKVLEAVMEHTTILPLAFGHIVPQEDDVVQKLIIPHKDALQESFAYLDGNIEVNLKAFWPDMSSIFATIASENSEIQRLKKKARVSRDDQIRAGEIAAKEIEGRRKSFAKKVIDGMTDIALEHKENKLFGDQMIANIAFLVPKNKIEEFDQKVNDASDEHGDAVHFKSIGPVPPYNFTNVRIVI
jgi:hypothetical protein